MACSKEYIAKNGNGACTAYKKKKAETTPEVVKETPKFEITEDTKTSFEPIVVKKKPKTEELTFNVLGGTKKSGLSGKIPVPEISVPKISLEGVKKTAKKIAKKVSGKCSGYGCPDY